MKYAAFYGRKSDGVPYKRDPEKAENAHPYADPKNHCLRRQSRNLLQLHRRNKSRGRQSSGSFLLFGFG